MARNAPAHFAATVADHVDAVEGAPVPEGRQVHGKVKSAKAFPLCLSLRPIRVTLPKGGIAGRQRPSMAEESAGGHRLRDSLFLPLRALGKRRVCGWPLGLICRLRYWPRQFNAPLPPSHQILGLEEFTLLIYWPSGVIRMGTPV